MAQGVPPANRHSQKSSRNVRFNQQCIDSTAQDSFYVYRRYFAHQTALRLRHGTTTTDASAALHDLFGLTEHSTCTLYVLSLLNAAGAR